MTNITSTVRWKSFTGNGSAGPFEFAFQINAYTEVKVYVDSTLKTAGSHYNVENSSSETSKINTDGTGRVRFTSSNFPTSSQTITIVSNVPLARTSVYTTGGPITASALETDLNTQLMHDQQIDKKLDRALVAPEYDIDTINMTLPAKASRLGTVLGFNATSGNPEAGPTIANVNSLSAITANINTVAGISSNVTTVAGISSNVTTVAGIASNVTTVAGVASLITSDFVSDLNTLATSDIVSDLNTLATSDVVSDLNTLATSDIVSDLNTLATSDIVSDLNTLATADIVSDLNTLATSDIVTDLNLLATSAIVEDLNLLATSSVIADMATLAGSGANPNITSLTASGTITGATLEATGDTSAGDNAAIGYTSAEGLILTGQGSTNDVTIKNDADSDVIEIPTGTTNVTIAGNLGVGGTVTGTGTSVFADLDISGDVDVDGTLEADAITVNGTALNTVIAGVTVTTATNATNSSHVLVTDNESTDEDNLITFVENATSSTGNVGLEMDGNLTYNPSTGKLTATQLAGTLQTAAQTNVTSVGTLSGLTVTGKPVINAGISVKNGSTSAGFIEFFEDSDNGTNKATLIGPASTGDVTLTLPASTGTIATSDEIIALSIALA